MDPQRIQQLIQEGIAQALPAIEQRMRDSIRQEVTQALVASGTQIREMLMKELSFLLTTDKYIFNRDIQLLDGSIIYIGGTSGVKFGSAATAKLAFYGSAPVIQQSSTGETTGVNGGAGTTVTHTATITGNLGTKAYTLSDIVKHLKTLGILASS